MSRTWRHSVVTAAFIAAIVAVVVLNGRAAGSGLGADETIHLAEVAHASGIDFDRDGLLDLYITGYFRSDIDFWHLKTTRIMQSSWDFASNGGKNLLFKNVGNGHFKDVTDSLGVGSTRWTLAAAAADFNDDGWPDLYLANDYGPEELFLNHDGKRFELGRSGLADDSKSGMAGRGGEVLDPRGHDGFVTDH